MADIETICPSYVGEPLIVLSLRDKLTVPRAYQLVELAVDYAALAAYGGAVLPLDFTVTPPTFSERERRVFTRFVPKSIIFMPTEPGPHQVTLVERFHNRIAGRLTVNVLTSS
jgi:hypothetical protein